MWYTGLWRKYKDALRMSTFENTRDDTLHLCACSPSLDYMYIQSVRSRFPFAKQTSHQSHATVHLSGRSAKKGKGILLDLREGFSYILLQF